MGNVLAAAFQDKYNVVGGTATCAGKDHFHWARGQVVAAAFGGAIHGDNVATAGSSNKKHALGAIPFNCTLHIRSPEKRFPQE